MIQQKIIPVIKCYSCGNCEINFHEKEDLNDKLGFCLRFKENVSLDEKNPACWTNKENQHYKQLHFLGINQKKEKKHLTEKYKEQLSLNFDNQKNPFQ